MRKFQLYINGRFVDGGDSFASVDPSAGEAWAQMPAATEGDIDRAAAAAHRAFHSAEWRGTTAGARGKLLWRLADLLAENANDIARLESRDTGKVIRETSAQTAYAAEYYRYFAGLADKCEGRRPPVDKPEMEVFTRREPLGVVAAIVPWNSQLFLAALKVGPALAAGNTVILKASEDGPAPLLEFARLVDAAGFPPGVVNVVTGFGETCGRALTSHPKVARVAFTGGPETARHIVRNSAENLAAVSLELGGKSPLLVFADADLDAAANAAVAGIFAAAGQSCVACSRLLAHRDVRDELLEKLLARLPKIRLGDPMRTETEVGPLATLRQRERIESALARSAEMGGRILAGGGRPAEFERGFYFSPTIAEAPAEAPVCAEEMFGPVLSVFSFGDEDEAAALANGSAHALAAGIFTRDVSRAHRMSRRLRAGIIWINTYRAVSPLAPIGGFDLSGFAREGGAESLLDYTRETTVWINTSSAPMPDPFVMR